MTQIENSKISCDVLIVGAGPAGLTTANLLGKLGVNTILLNRETEILELPRAVGMCDEGSRVIHAAGLMDDLEKEMHPISDVYFMSKKSTLGFRFDTASVVNGFQILRSIYQPGVERILRKGLERYPHVKLISPAEFLQFVDLGTSVSSQVKVLDNNDDNSVDGEQNVSYINISSRFLLACDGASSSIRKMLGIEFTGHTYGQDWIVVDVENDPMPVDTPIHFICDPDRPGVTLPTPNRTRRWEFVLKKGENEDAVCAVESIHNLLKPWGDSKLMNVQRKAVYTFHALTARRFKIGNVFLLGDAAHLTPPFAGQGLMAGLRDSNNLAWKLSMVLKGHLPETFLESYHEERKPQAIIIIALARFMGLLILPQSKLMSSIRDGFFALHRNLSGNRKLERSAELRKAPNSTLGYRALFHWFRDPDKVSAGFELPFVTVSKSKHESGSGSGSESECIDDALAGSFYLLSTDGALKDYVSTEVGTHFEKINGKIGVLDTQMRSVRDGRFLMELGDKLSSQLTVDNEVLLVRPDRFVVFGCNKKQLDSVLSAYLNKIDPEMAESPANLQVA